MEQVVSNISDFCSAITKINKNAIQNNSYKNGKLFFRGQSDDSYDLLPAIGRNANIGNATILDMERNLIEMAKYKLPDVFCQDLDPIDLLALLQHYGIPTRLLDITENALVALYFACSSNFEKDGEVIIFQRKDKDIANYPLINAIADSYRFVSGTDYPIVDFYDAVIDQPYFLEQRHELDFDREKEIKNLIKFCESPEIVYASTRTQRQQLQQGAYILFPNSIKTIGDSNKYYFTTQIKLIDKNSEIICTTIKIPKNEKESFISDLKLFGISQETLFSDSVDIVCQEIAKDYNKLIQESVHW